MPVGGQHQIIPSRDGSVSATNSAVNSTTPFLVRNSVQDHITFGIDADGTINGGTINTQFPTYYYYPNQDPEYQWGYRPGTLIADIEGDQNVVIYFDFDNFFDFLQ